MGEGWRSGAAESAKCLFCGALGTWFDRGEGAGGCSCEVARRVRLPELTGGKPTPGKLNFQMVSRGGQAVIVRISKLAWEAMREAGVMRVPDTWEEVTGRKAVPDSVPDIMPPAPDVPDNVVGVPDNVCVVCGKAFAARRGAKYCSGACRKRAQRAHD